MKTFTKIHPFFRHHSY